MYIPANIKFILTFILCTLLKVNSQIIVFHVDELDCIPGNYGTFTMQLQPDWAPIGAQRVKELAASNFFVNTRFFRVMPGFVAQFGIHGNPEVSSYYKQEKMVDDPVRQTNSYGTVTFATSGPNTRTTQLFINYGNNAFLDSQGFAPVGKIIQGMDVVERICDKYSGNISQGSIMSQG